ncbi:hypothetical protein F4811DRAFT_269470 [Daldinia bambusicola]|nr:hypothetical protein F4811DRAFT_269470 [Daldinia bambusicola]
MDRYATRSLEENVEQTKSDFRGSCVLLPKEENIKLMLSEEWCTNDIDITLLSKGTYSYTYLITKPTRDKLTNTIIRVMLPIDPYFKTQAEVSSMEWVREYTPLAVPKVRIFDQTGTTQIGLEWIVLECPQGSILPMREAGMGEIDWGMVSDGTKRSLVRQLVAFYSATFDHQLFGIGNLYMGYATGERDRDDKIGVIVSPEFYTYNQTSDLGRGPFRNSAEWLKTRINMRQKDRLAISNTKVAIKAKHILDRLKRLGEMLFDSTLFEPTLLTNCEINHNSLLVNRNKLAILGWEHTSALPLWKGCELPKFLQGIARNKQPEERDYLDKQGQWLAGAKDDFDKHIFQWERTSLQKMFLDEMSRTCPQWTTIYNSPITRLRKDFDLAVSFSDDAATQPAIEKWLYTVESGLENIRLQNPGKSRVDISSLGFTIRSLQDRIYDSTNVSGTARQLANGPESHIWNMS